MYDVDQKRNTIDRYLHVLAGDVAPLLRVLEHIVQLDLVCLQGLGAVQQELLAPDELVVAVGDHSLGRTILCWPVLSRDLHLERSLQRVLVNVVDDVGAGGGAVGPQPVPQGLAVQVGGDGQTWCIC